VVSRISHGRLQYIRWVTASPTQKTKTKKGQVISIGSYSVTLHITLILNYELSISVIKAPILTSECKFLALQLTVLDDDVTH
jgi:hypothetical protein